MTVSTHVLDASRGRPAPNVAVALCQRNHQGDFSRLVSGSTDADGRWKALSPTGALELSPGVYRIDFETGPYFASMDQAAFYPQVSITFEVLDPMAHYHVPLLLSPFAYSTYRGS